MELLLRTVATTAVAAVLAVLLNKLIFGSVDTWKTMRAAAIFAVVFLIASLVVSPGK